MSDNIKQQEQPVTMQDIMDKLNSLEVTLFERFLDYLNTMKKEILNAVDTKLNIVEKNIEEFKYSIKKQITYQDKIIDNLEEEVSAVKHKQLKHNMGDMKKFIYIMAGITLINSGLLIYLIYQVAKAR